MYVVETPKPLRHAPVDEALVEAWIRRVATLRLDSATPSAEMVIDRLRQFWILAETVVYIGLAGTSLAKRVGQYYRTPLGDPRPHAGGHWIKTLGSLDTFLIWFAESIDPAADEEALLHAFGDRHGSRSILPFANLEDARRVRKPHGITGARLSRGRVAAPVPRMDGPTLRVPRPTPAPVPTRQRGHLDPINAALQAIACASNAHEVTAVEAARELDRLGLLRDSPARPGLPLRKKLRAGSIQHAYQVGGRFWFIRCGRD